MNVGYSYGKSKVKNTQESAVDVYAFLQLFLDEYKEYASNPFHIAGESYGKATIQSCRLSHLQILRRSLSSRTFFRDHQKEPRGG